MPTAAKLEKQSSTETVEPIKQAIIIIEHKIRNLEKRKRKVEIYREDQSKGQTLNSDQLSAVAKYDEITKTLDFAQDLCKQFSSIATETVKVAKKQGRKEAAERSMQDAAKIREVLVIQDILQHMGLEGVRGDFLAGRNNAAKLTEKDLTYLDDLYITVSPKRDISEDSLPPFEEQVTLASEHLLSIVEGNKKDVVGTTYEYLKELIIKIQVSGYFDKLVSHSVELVPEEPKQVNVKVEEPSKKVAEPVVMEKPSGMVPLVSEHVVSTVVTQAPPGLGPVTLMLADPYLNQPSVNELMQTVAGSFNFLQESELDIPCVEPASPTIPSQTFTNQNYSPTSAPVVSQAQTQSQVGFGGVPVCEMAATIPGFTTPNPPPPIPMPPSHRSSPYAATAAADTWPTANEAEVAANEWQPSQPCPTDWAADTTGEWLPGDDGSGFTVQVSGRQQSTSRNRSARHGAMNSGANAGVSNYHEGGSARNNSGYQRTNDTNASVNNYQPGQQNGYQHYGSGGGSNSGGGMGGQYRPRSHQRGSGNRNGPPSRGGGANDRGANDHGASHGRSGRPGAGSYGGRPQNNRQ